MAFKEFSIGFSRTINLGHYESARVEASVTIEQPAQHRATKLLDSEEIQNAQNQLRELLEKTWKEQFKTTKDPKQ